MTTTIIITTMITITIITIMIMTIITTTITAIASLLPAHPAAAAVSTAPRKNWWL